MSDTTVLIIVSMLMIMMSLIMILLVQSTILLNKIIKSDEKATIVLNENTSDRRQFLPEKENAKKIEVLKVPDLDPFSIAPNLKKPPKSMGGLGDKTDKNDP
jgi:hypothetical protein